MNSSVLRGIYIEKVRQATMLLADIVGASDHDNIATHVTPYLKILSDAQNALRNIHDQLRQDPKVPSMTAEVPVSREVKLQCGPKRTNDNQKANPNQLRSNNCARRHNS